MSQLKFRDTVPNPAGGEWTKVTETEGDRNVDIMHDRMQAVLKRDVIPGILANVEGDVKASAEMLATLFLGFLQNFLAENVEDPKSVTYLGLADAALNCMAHAQKQAKIIHTLRQMGMPGPIISAMLHSLMADDNDGEPNIKVFRMKTGDELPQELTDLLRGKKG